MQGITPKDTSGAAAGIERMGADELLRAGSQHFRAREYSQARALLERYTRLVPSDAGALHLLARVYYHENENLDGAVECINSAIRLDPQGASRYLLTLAEVYIHQGDYAGAGVVLEEAAAQDTGKDPKHAYAIDFYRNMVEKKLKVGRKPARGAKEPAVAGYSAKKDSRYNQRGRHLFLIPSVALHALVLMLLMFLSGMDITTREEFREDFTFVEVSETVAEEEPQQAEEGETAPASEAEAGPGRTEASRAEAAPKGVARGESAVRADTPLEMPKEGPRTLTAAKTAGSLGAVRAAEGESLEAPSVGEKAAGQPDRPSVSDESAVYFRPGELKLGDEKGGSAKKAGRGAASISERSGLPSAGIAAAGGAASAGGDRPRGGPGGKAAASLKAEGKEGEAGPRAGAGEKRLALGSTSAARGAGLPEAGFSRPSAGQLGISPAGQQGEAGRGGSARESFKTVDKGGAKVSAQGIGSGPYTGGGTGGPGLPAGRAPSGGLASGGGTGAELPGPSVGGERMARLDVSRGSRGFSGGGAVPSPRGLGIQEASEGGKASAQSRRERGAPGGIGEKGSSIAKAAGPPGQGVGGPELQGKGSGYSGAAGTGKGAGTGTLRAAATEGGGPGAASVGERQKGLPGGRARSGSAAAPDAAPRRSGGLEGLLSGAAEYIGKALKGGSGGEGGAGVRLGSGEKSGTAAPSGSGLGGVSGQAGSKTGTGGGKKDAEEALGVPGGKGRERYASAAGTKPAPIAPEKLSGVRVASKGGAKEGFGPSVRIMTPAPGDTREIAQVVTGIVSDPRINKATLTVNGDSRVISVSEGRFESAVALQNGRNVITVMAFDKEGNAGKDSVTLDCRSGGGSVPVKITEPRDGQIFDVSQNSVIKVRGTIGDTRIKRARMILNGRPKDILVKDGRFSQEVALTQEKNTVVVEAVDGGGDVSSSGTVGFGTMNIKPKDIMIILTWDRPNADFDLHVHSPTGGHTSYASPNIYESNQAISGAQLEQDAKGNFGPEVFTMERSEKGVYTVKSNYYYSGGDGDAHSTVTVILYGDNPARRIVRVFGPHLQVDTKTGAETWDVARFKMPEGIFLED